MKVTVAAHAGFCFGVRRAIEDAQRLLDQGVSADGAYPYKKGTATLAELLAANKRMKDSPQKAELAQRLGAK